MISNVFWALNNVLYTSIRRNQKAVMFRLFPDSAFTVTFMWETQDLRCHGGLWNLLTWFWLVSGSMHYWECLSGWWYCVQSDLVRNRRLDRFLLSSKKFLFFCIWHYFEGIKEQQKHHLRRTVRYQLLWITPQLPPLITYSVSWDLLQSNNSDALHLHTPFLQGVQSSYRYDFTINII